MRLIDADAMKSKLVGSRFHYIRNFLNKQPTIEAEPVRHGRWIVTKEYNDVIDMDVVKYACSACGEYRLSATTLSQATNYCPNCGAKMDGDNHGNVEM